MSSAAGPARRSRMRLLVHVEGQTEELFVNAVLAPHLYSRGYHGVFTQLVGTRRGGGICSWASAKRDIIRHRSEDPDRIVTTMVDYYGLPHKGGRAWPGRAASARLPLDQRAAHV